MNHLNETSISEVETTENFVVINSPTHPKQIMNSLVEKIESKEITGINQIVESSIVEAPIRTNSPEERDDTSSNENDHIFKKPESTQHYLKRDHNSLQSTSQMLMPENTAEYVTTECTMVNCEGTTNPTNFRIFISGEQDELHNVENNQVKKVELEVEDNMPCFYDIKSDSVSKPYMLGRLAEAYEPICAKYIVNPEDKVQKTDLKSLQQQKIRKIVGNKLNDEHFDKLKLFCSPDNLRTGLEITMKSSYPLSTFSAMNEVRDYFGSAAGNQGAGDHLQTIRKHKLRTARDITNFYTKRLKYRGLKFMPFGDSMPESRSGAISALVPGKDLLFRIRLYRPFPYSPRERKRSGNRHPVFCSDLVLTGRNTLEQLRDTIRCSNDEGLRIDISDQVNNKPLSSCKELFPSGFLFINGVFYNDRRPGCADYSAPLREWARRRRVGDCACAALHDVRLGQLTVKLGYPEVYMHQGNCEHLFTFSEVRLIGPGDPLDPSAYPSRSLMSMNHTIYCTTCAEFAAKWVVTECSRVPFDPAFFCDTCFNLYLYVDGKKIGNFKAYPYNTE